MGLLLRIELDVEVMTQEWKNHVKDSEAGVPGASLECCHQHIAEERQRHRVDVRHESLHSETGTKNTGISAPRDFSHVTSLPALDGKEKLPNCWRAFVLKVVALIEMSSYPWICVILLLYSNRHLNFHLDTCPPVIKITCPISHVAGMSINLLFSFFTFLLVKYRRKKICPVDFWQERKNNVVRERKRVFLTNGAGTIGINFKK